MSRLSRFAKSILAIAACATLMSAQSAPQRPMADFAAFRIDAPYGGFEFFRLEPGVEYYYAPLSISVLEEMKPTPTRSVLTAINYREPKPHVFVTYEQGEEEKEVITDVFTSKKEVVRVPYHTTVNNHVKVRSGQFLVVMTCTDYPRILTVKAALFQHPDNGGRRYEAVPDKTVRDMDLSNQQEALFFKKVCGMKLDR